MFSTYYILQKMSYFLCWTSYAFTFIWTYCWCHWTCMPQFAENMKFAFYMTVFNFDLFYTQTVVKLYSLYLRNKTFSIFHKHWDLVYFVRTETRLLKQVLANDNLVRFWLKWHASFKLSLFKNEKVNQIHLCPVCCLFLRIVHSWFMFILC